MMHKGENKLRMRSLQRPQEKVWKKGQKMTGKGQQNCDNAQCAERQYSGPRGAMVYSAFFERVACSLGSPLWKNSVQKSAWDALFWYSRLWLWWLHFTITVVISPMNAQEGENIWRTFYFMARLAADKIIIKARRGLNETWVYLHCIMSCSSSGFKRLIRCINWRRIRIHQAKSGENDRILSPNLKLI